MRRIAASSILAAGLIWAQTKATAPAFEVAAIRPAEFPSPQGFRGGGGPQGFRAGMQLDAGRLDWRLASLSEMIQYAFHVTNYQLSGPDWMRSSRWNVQATLPADASQTQVPQMMQALLADRFQLEIHHDQREQPVYALEVLKGGSKLETFDASSEPSAGDTAAAPAGPAAPGLFPGPFGGGFGRGPGGPPPDGPDARGGRGPGFMTTTGPNGATARMSQGEGCTMRVELSKFTSQDLADTLSPFFDKPVVDATGLKGTYKATLELPMEAMFSMMQNMMRANGMPGPGQGGPGRGDGGPGGPGGPGGRGRGGPDGCDPGAMMADGSGDNANAAIVHAVQKLGLKLEAKKAPFDTIVVDHVEKTPTEN
jgi:uncharacterized protein (TIGR03435 family)